MLALAVTPTAKAIARPRRAREPLRPCPRCQELLAGAPARKGWGAAAKRAEALRIQAIKTHNCQTHGCGPVCVYGDW